MKIRTIFNYDHLIEMVEKIKTDKTKFIVQHSIGGINWEITEEQFIKTCSDHRYRSKFFQNVVYSDFTKSFIYRG